MRALLLRSWAESSEGREYHPQNNSETPRNHCMRFPSLEKAETFLQYYTLGETNKKAISKYSQLL